MDTFTIKNLSFSYPGQTENALDDISLSIEKGGFLTLCGPSGCGKSTLLRQMKPVLVPHGDKCGEILFEGILLEALNPRSQAEKIGYVLQNPDNQVVTDKVWHELAFGLESLGLDTPTIRRRVAEIAGFFGIEEWFHKNVTELSGGQKQLLNLASVMVMQPSVLILDEPTSQLDPIAAAEFLACVGRINRELGVTVVLTEHRLEDALPLSTDVAVMEAGKIICTGTAAEVGQHLRGSGHDMFLAMPAAMRIWAAVPNELPCPVTVRDGRGWLALYAASSSVKEVRCDDAPGAGREAGVVLEDVWFKYEKDLPDVLRGLSLTAYKGELLAILGGNGAGKTTSLLAVAGTNRPYRGKVACSGGVAALPQNPQALFVKKTVREDLFEIAKKMRLPQNEQELRVARVVKLCQLNGLLGRHPYDLSGGEQQRAALAQVLLLNPAVLLLDEPTKGLDAVFKKEFAQMLQALMKNGVTVIMASHDVEFCAKYAHRCALFFDGALVSQGVRRDFFTGNSFYTTAANRIARGVIENAVTTEDVVAACGGTLPEPNALLEDDFSLLPLPEPAKPDAPPKLPLWRKVVAALSALAALATFIGAITVSDLSSLLSSGPGETLPGNATSQGLWQLIPAYAAMLASLVAFALATGHRQKIPRQPPLGGERGKLPKRTVLSAVMVLFLIPLTIYFGIYFLGDRKYYFISLMILFEIMLPFALVFEGRRPQARELAVIAVLCMLGIAGRAAFFALPGFKPVMALVIISGVAFGGETGFLVGAVTMLASNMMFGQGPWTPWQMFAMGLVGFLAGALFHTGLMGRSKASLAVFGGLAAIVVYGSIMNFASAVIWARDINWGIVFSYMLIGFPMDLVHAVSTVVFLLLAAEMMLERLDRIKVKYGLITNDTT